MRLNALPALLLTLALSSVAPVVAAEPAPLAAEACLGCHGPDGRGGAGAIPIAGRDKAEIAAILLAFRANERPGTIMGRVARGYTDAEIAAVADHYSRIR